MGVNQAEKREKCRRWYFDILPLHIRAFDQYFILPSPQCSSTKRRGPPRHSRWWNKSPDRLGVLVFTALKRPGCRRPAYSWRVGDVWGGARDEGRRQDKKKHLKRDAHTVIRSNHPTPHPTQKKMKCLSVKGVARRYWMLNHSSFASLDSFGSVMSSLGRRQGRRQTKETGPTGRRSWGGVGASAGGGWGVGWDGMGGESDKEDLRRWSTDGCRKLSMEMS